MALPKAAADAQHFHNVYIHLGLCYNDCLLFVVKVFFFNHLLCFCFLLPIWSVLLMNSWLPLLPLNLFPTLFVTAQY